MKTLRSVLKDKVVANAILNKKLDIAERERDRIAQILRENPGIGVLQKGDHYSYYSYKGGQFRESLNPAELV